MVDIAQKIREIRKNLGLTQAEFADALKASQGSVSKWETGRETPRLDAIAAIQKLSGLNLMSLRSGREHQFSRGGAMRFVSVVGNIQSNYATEKSVWHQDDWFELELPFPAHWGPVHLEGRLVKGLAVWGDFPPGTIVITASDTNALTDYPDHSTFADPMRVSEEDGDIVVCALPRENDMFEVVLRQVVRHSDGQLALWQLADSNEPTKLPVVLARNDQGKYDYEILGIVAYVIKPETPDDRFTYVPNDILF